MKVNKYLVKKARSDPEIFKRIVTGARETCRYGDIPKSNVQNYVIRGLKIREDLVRTISIETVKHTITSPGLLITLGGLGVAAHGLLSGNSAAFGVGGLISLVGGILVGGIIDSKYQWKERPSRHYRTHDIAMRNKEIVENKIRQQAKNRGPRLEDVYL